MVSAVRVSSAAFLAAALSSIRFIQASYSHLVPVARLSSSSNERLPFVVDAVRALSLHQQLALLPPTIDLDALASASPKSTSQHVFAERVHLQVRRRPQAHAAVGFSQSSSSPVRTNWGRRPFIASRATSGVQCWILCSSCGRPRGSQCGRSDPRKFM